MRFSYKLRIFLCLPLCLLLLMLAAPVSADHGPMIRQQPASPNYTEYAVAIYEVKAGAPGYSATWYIEYEGTVYNASNLSAGMQPWEAYAGESYGPHQPDEYTFQYQFCGIEQALNGAKIWCVVTDGHVVATSESAFISVGSSTAPPQIVDFPAKLIARQNEPAELRCVAIAPEGTQLQYIWYESSTGKLQDIRAIESESEFSDCFLCPTDTLGSRYYFCGVFTSDGGVAYTGMAEVVVIESPLPTTPPTTAATTPPTTLAPTVPPTTTPAAQPTTAPAAQPTTAPAAQPTTAPAPTQPIPDPQTEAPGVPLWAVILIAVAAAGAGVAVTVILLKRKK